MIYSRFINQISSGRQPSLIREMTRILAAASKEMIPLSGGFPNPAMFPVTNITVSVPNTGKINLSGPDLASALQYLPTNGHPGLLQQLRDLQQSVHQPHPGVWDNSDIVITSGSQDGLCKAFEMMMSQGRNQGELEVKGITCVHNNLGSGVIVEDFVYSGTLSILNPYQPTYHVIKSDNQGMRPDSLRKVLSRWTPGGEEDGCPKVLYINPTGANPTGKLS